MKRTVLGAFLLAGLALPSVASADEPSPAAPKAPLVQSDGTTIIDTDGGATEAAIDELQRQYAGSGDYKLLYNLGRLYRQENDYVRAIGAFKRYLEKGGEGIPEERRAEVTKELDVLQSRTARVIVSSELGGLEIRIDGNCAVDAATYEPVCTSKETDRVLLAGAGEHRLTVKHAGFRDIAHVLTLEGGQEVRVRVTTVKLEAEENPYRDSMWTAWAVTGGGAVGTAIVGIRVALTQQGLNSAPGIATLVLGAATVIAGGFAAYFTVKSSSWRPSKATSMLSNVFTVGAVTDTGVLLGARAPRSATLDLRVRF